MAMARATGDDFRTRPLRLHMVSDLHLEFHDDEGAGVLRRLKPGNTDALVIAGDLCGASQLERTLRAICDIYPKVIYVVGNHEYYGTDPDMMLRLMEKCANQIPNLAWLRGFDVVTVDGVIFAGGTLWFRRFPVSEHWAHRLTDFMRIQDFTPWVWEENKRHRMALRGLRFADVIISHHLPTESCISERYINSPINQYFLSESCAEIARLKPRYWLFGHTHDRFTKEFQHGGSDEGKTELVCHALGYPDEIPSEYLPLELKVPRRYPDFTPGIKPWGRGESGYWEQLRERYLFLGGYQGIQNGWLELVELFSAEIERRVKAGTLKPVAGVQISVEIGRMCIDWAGRAQGRGGRELNGLAQFVRSQAERVCERCGSNDQPALCQADDYGGSAWWCIDCDRERWKKPY